METGKPGIFTTKIILLNLTKKYEELFTENE
jgi:hypothetical protein